ncbi:MAG: hypothetical protein EOO43_05925 [Flavobacterium sp.]|nr:MAG: hypothetical protein EOO43_05925 [Flavobacterium sp.]
MRIFLIILSSILILIGIYVSWEFFRILGEHFNYDGSGELKMDATGQTGDFIGGIVGTIFSLAGFFILIVTLQVQAKSSYIEQFESKFFELIKLHRDNVAEIHINRQMIIKEKLVGIEYIGRKSFKIIMDEFITCRNDLKPFFNSYTIDEIYEPDFKAETSQILLLINQQPDLRKHAKVNVAYCVMFFGVGFEGNLILRSLFKGKYKDPFIDQVIKYLQMKPIESSDYWGRWKSIKKFKRFDYRLEIVNKILNARLNNGLIAKMKIQDLFYDSAYVKYYGGHQHRLGHYFRHLFQCVNYVNNQSRLSDKQKYFYVKTLRAQLSTYEQALLFVNSISFLGMRWELNPSYQRSIFSFINTSRKRNNQLITKYNLIKNLPGEHIFGTRYRDYYPNVQYELDTMF